MVKTNKYRDRAYKDWDFQGIAAVGDVWYKDEWDDWGEMRAVFDQSGLEVPIVRKHGDTEFIGKINAFQLDNGKKTIHVGFNESDLVSGVMIQDFSGVSPRWIEKDGRIAGIEHFAISNDFNPLCPKDLCSIRNRGEETEAVVDVIPEVTPEPFDYEKGYNTLVENYNDLIDRLDKKPEEPGPEPQSEKDPEPKPEKKVVLKPKVGEGIVKTPPSNLYVKGGIFDNVTQNTTRINNMRK